MKVFSNFKREMSWKAIIGIAVIYILFGILMAHSMKDMNCRTIQREVYMG